MFKATVTKLFIGDPLAVKTRSWFVGMLLLGIFNFGFFAMIAYLVGGPDGTAEAAIRRARTAAQANPA